MIQEKLSELAVKLEDWDENCQVEIEENKKIESVSIQTHITSIKQNGTLETEFIKVWKLSGNAWKRLVKKEKSIFKFKLN